MKRGGTFKSALLAFFLMCVCGLHTNPIAPDQSRSAFERTVYLFDAFYAAAFSGPGKRDSGPSPNPVPVAKKSAVLRGRFDLVPQSGRIAVFTPADLAVREDFSIEDKRAAIMRSWLRKNYACLRLSSGVSPPLLS